MFRWKTKNKCSLGVLWIKFLSFYAGEQKIIDALYFLLVPWALYWGKIAAGGNKLEIKVQEKY